MDEKSLVLVQNSANQWEDKTEEIIEYIVDPIEGCVKILYKGNSRKYTYRQGRVRLLAATAVLNPSEVQLRVGGRLLPKADMIIKYPGFYLVKTPRSRKLYEEAKVCVERDIAVDPACKIVLDYFRSVANRIGIKGENEQSILKGQYKYLSRVPNSSVLAAYLSPGSKLKELTAPGPLIYPFGTNASQKTAVEKAFQSQVSIVQGPPGTGKTQTILNIVANAICFRQTVAIVSNNNAATKNVADKLKAKQQGFLLAALGRRANKETFIEMQCGYPEWIAQAVKDSEEMKHLEERITSLTTKLDKLVQADNDRSTLVTRIGQMQAELELHRKITDSLPSPEVKLKRWSANDLLSLLVECEETDKRMGLLKWFTGIFRYGFSKLKERRQLLAAGPVIVRSLYYDKCLIEMQAQLEALEDTLANNDFRLIQNQVEEVSWELLCASIAERFQNKIRPVFAGQDLWTKYADILNEYPVVLSTTHSLKTSLSPDCLYDVVIIDEASQVDLATGVLALSCAKRVVIVGDEKQLPNVIDEDARQCAVEVWHKSQLTCPAWNYVHHSLLSSALAFWPQAPNVLLREHYRCHPKIVGFFNRQFYGDRLIVMTEDHDEKDAIQAVFTVPGNHARGRINQRQIDVIVQEILPALRQKGITDIGVIAPYRDQVAVLRRILGDVVEVDTVHGFQGREKQAIIMSTVDNEIGDFVNDPRMLNVAVSRAQRSFTVVSRP